MRPEEIINKERWFVLQRVKTRFLRTTAGQPVEYELTNVIGGDYPSSESEAKTLVKLEEFGVIKIVGQTYENVYMLEILEPAFSNFYNTLENDLNKTGRETEKQVGGMRIPGGIVLGPLMFSRDGKVSDAILGPAIIPFDYGITNLLNSLNARQSGGEEFQVIFNSQVEDLVAEMLIYFQNRLKPITKTNVGQFNSIGRCKKEYAKYSINLDELCDIKFLLNIDSVRGHKHHTSKRYDGNYTIGNVDYGTVEKLRELNRRVHKEIHTVNDNLATTHKDYDVKVTQTPNSTIIEFTAASHAFDLTRGGKIVSKKNSESQEVPR